MFHINIKKKINSGFFGTTYLIEYIANKHAIIKLEKIDIDESENSYWRQLQFDKEICQLNKHLFLTIEAHGVINNCGPEYKKKVYKRRFIENSPWFVTYGVFVIQTPVLQKTVFDAYPLNEEKQAVNFQRYIQTFDILKKNGYTHGDTHLNNWMIDEKDEIWLIDYGTVTKNKWKFKWNPTLGFETDVLFSLRLFVNDPYVALEKKGYFIHVDYPGIVRAMNTSNNIQYINQYCSEKAKSEKANLQFIFELLLMLLDWKSYSKCVFPISNSIPSFSFANDGQIPSNEISFYTMEEPIQNMKDQVLYVISQLYADSYTDLVAYSKKYFEESKIKKFKML